MAKQASISLLSLFQFDLQDRNTSKRVACQR